MTTSSILSKLKGGDRRSIGRSNEVGPHVLARPDLLRGLFAGLSVDNPVVRSRAADAVEKISVIHPERLHPYRVKLAGELARCEQKELRWRAAQMLPRFRWNTREQQQIYNILSDYLRDSSSIVKTFAI